MRFPRTPYSSKSPFNFVPLYLGLRPGEQTRWEVRHDGLLIGWASSFYADGRTKWFAQTLDGKRQEVRSRKAAADVIYDDRAATFVRGIIEGLGND